MRPAAIAVVLVCAAASTAFARDLTFEDRVRAQEAIERVYYSHQLGATKPFEEAVPRAVIENKVRTYLEQTLALDRVWGRPVTGDALRDELLRMARETRLPDRLSELFQALHQDPFLIQECLARPLLVDRTAREAFAMDRAIHAGARRAAERVYRDLVARRIDPAVDHPRRRVDRLVEEEGTTATRDADPSRVELKSEEFARARAMAPARVGEIGPIAELSDSFVIQVALAESPGAASLASYVFEKRSWPDWWSRVAPDLGDLSVRAVASPQVDLPGPSALAAGPCPADDTWTFRGRPTERRNHVAVWTGSVMVVWGGEDGYTPARQPIAGGRYDPVTDAWAPTSTVNAPAGRSRAAAVWTGTEMVVWGGFNGSYLDTGGRYDPLADSWRPTSTTNAPSARGNSLSVWTGTRMIVWGGNDAFSAVGTGGRYDPVADTWTPTTNSSAPTARSGATAVWTGAVMTVWGGEFGTMLATGSRYNPVADSWSATATSGAPSARRNHAAVWTGSRMVVWGGRPDNSTSLGDGAAYDPVQNKWRAISAAGAPTARSEASAIWTGSRMVVWGGYDPNNAPDTSTGGRYDPTADTWSPTSTIGVPLHRYGHTAVWTGSRMLVWGGYGESSFRDDGRRYDPAADTWTSLAATGAPSARYGHAAVWTGTLMIVWGGAAPPFNYANTGGRFDPSTSSWTPTTTTGAPAGQYRPRALWTGNLMIVWGGSTSGGSGQRGGRYDPVADSWLPVSTTGAPPNVAASSAVWTGRSMVVWGGVTGATSVQSGGRYDPVADTWSPTTTIGAPTGRSTHSAVWTGSRMIIWGGQVMTPSGPVELDTGGRYDPVDDTWSPTSMTNAPPPNANPLAAWTEGYMVIWAPFDESRRYDPVADKWTPVSTTNAPAFEYQSTLISTGPLMLVWGGDNPVVTDAGGRYDPIRDAWMPTTTAQAPLARGQHTAVWTGRSMLVWGGKDNASALGSDGEYIADPDLDGDGLNACEGDCSQRDGTVFPGAPQTCDGLNNDCGAPGWPSLSGTNEADNDYDGLSACQSDCNDADPGAWARPVEVAGIAVTKAAAGTTELSWASQSAGAGSATVYDVVTGSLDDARLAGSFAGANCLADDHPSSFYADGRSGPTAGSWYYLVRAANTCGRGGFGDSSIAPDPRDTLDTSSPCP